MIISFIRNNAAALMRYIVVGVFVYGLECIVYVALVQKGLLSPIAANAAAKLAAGFFAYFAHRLFTFKKAFSDAIYQDLLRYIACLAINIPLFSAIYYCISLFELNYLLTKIAADVICIFIAYIQTKFFVFGDFFRK